MNKTLLPLTIVALAILTTITVANNINKSQDVRSRAALLTGTALQDEVTAFWNNAQPFNDNEYINWYPWSNGGPTAGWESPLVNYTYVCNQQICWTIDRGANVFTNNGNPFKLSTNSSYSTLVPSGTTYPWTNGGPTSAWTWSVRNAVFTDLPDTTRIQETMVCNGNACWRFERHPTDATKSVWRDNGAAVNLP